MSGKSIASTSAVVIEKILSHVKRSVIFVDNPCAEIFHWHSGLKLFLDAGAFGVKEFSSFESADSSQQKGVFIVSTLLEGVTSEIIRDIIQASKFQYVVVITAHSSQLHRFSHTGTILETDDKSDFQKFEDNMLMWMGNVNYTAEVFHYPLFSISLGQSLFLTPANSHLFPLMNSDINQVELQYNSHRSDKHSFDGIKEIGLQHLPMDLQKIYKMLVASLNSLLSEMGVREDVYCVGHTSHILATELENFPLAKSRRKTAQNRASLVLVDRTLDMVSVMSHSSETLMDRLSQTLPRLSNQHNTDLHINMARLCCVDKQLGADVIAPGCLASSSFENSSQSHLQSVLTSKMKDALMDVNRQLVEAASRAGLPISLKGKPTKVTAEQLYGTLDLFKGKYKQITSHLDAIQVAMAAAESLNCASGNHCDELLGVEKGLVQSMADDDLEAVTSQLLKLLHDKDQEDKRNFNLDDILALLVFVYSMLETDSLGNTDLEKQLQAAIVKKIMENQECLPPVIKSIVGEASAESMVADIVEDLWEKLISLSSAREHLQQFRSILDPGSAVSLPGLNPLLKQLVAAIFDPSKPDLPSIECKSSGFRDILKSGFGLFRSVAKARPSDAPLMILFVVGGVTSMELKQIKDVLHTYKTDTQVILGSTRLITPADGLNLCLAHDNVNISDVR
ncbi:hypothetical protein ACJMK2_038362 [Sinanodonta woodiana]|uniref:Sec1 family domain-containing protein 2 n=1 Tax=Sinanodonta woodiana TaxID=1069815 RepID=A0ABD3W9L6_SINWO